MVISTEAVDRVGSEVGTRQMMTLYDKVRVGSNKHG